MSIKVLGVGSPLVDVLAQVNDDYVSGIDGEKGGMQMVDSAGLQSLLDSHGDANAQQ